MIYLKLGEKASSFYDSTSKLLIRGLEVVALPSMPKSKKVTVARNGGHIVIATKTDYLNYISTTKGAVVEEEKVTVEIEEEAPKLNLIKVPKSLKKGEQAELNRLLEGLKTLDEVAEHFKLGGWDDSDVESLLTLPADSPIADVIYTAMQIEKTYN
jgi:hypothetical protein